MSTNAAISEPNWDLIPESVRRKAEEAKKLLASETATPGEGAPEGETPPAQALETPPSPVPAAPEPVVPSVEAPIPSAADFKDIVTPEMTTEQRYKIMEGIQKAAGRDLSKAQREAAALREELEALRAQAQSRPAPVTVPEPVAPPPVDNAVRERLMMSMGEENLNDIVAFLRSQGFAVTQDLSKLQQEVGQVSKTVATSAQESFYHTMDTLAPGWREINVQDWFIDAMNEEEGNTGVARLEFAKQHLARMDAPRLARYFTDLKPPTADATPRPAAQKLDKQKYVAPGSSRVAAPSIDGDVKMVKLGEFAKFAEDVRNGRYEDRTDPERHKKLQEMMFAQKARLDDARRLGHIIKD